MRSVAAGSLVAMVLLVLAPRAAVAVATPCGNSTPPVCGGVCPSGSTCRPARQPEATADKEAANAATQGGASVACFCARDTPPGACCLPNASCQQLMQADCLAAGGFFAGDGVACSADACLDPGGYDPSACTTPFQDIAGSGTALLLGDDQGQVVPLGFSYAFYSAVHTSIGVSSNGFLSFGSNLTTFGDVPIPNPNSPNSLIAPLWDDLNPGAGGAVHYQTLGTAPNRRFVAQWTGVPEFFDTGANTLQAILFETGNAIEFHYGALSAAGGTIGVENRFGTLGTAVDRASIGAGDCIRLTPTSAPAEAPALGTRSIAVLVLALLAIALLNLRRAASIS